MRAFVNNQSGAGRAGRLDADPAVRQAGAARGRRRASRTRRSGPRRRAAATEQSYSRKLRELRYAVALEEKYSKRQILERYLNIAYFGGGAYGVEAAARRYFSTHARDLTLAQAATAGRHRPAADRLRPDPQPRALPRPAQRRARPDGRGRPGRPAGGRGGEGHRARPQAGEALAGRTAARSRRSRSSATSCSRRSSTTRRSAPRATTGPTCCCAAASPSPRPSTANAQRNAQDVAGRPRQPDATRWPPRWPRCSPGTGQIKAMAVSRGFGDEQGADQVQPRDRPGVRRQPRLPGRVDVQGRSSPRPPWRRATRSTTASTRRTRSTSARSRAATARRSTTSGTRSTRPRARTATTRCRPASRARSTPTSPSSTERVGVCRPAQIAEALGVRRADGKKLQAVKSFTLGVNEVSPLTMAEAYATFAARGTHCNAVAILEVTDPTGNRLSVPDADCQQVHRPGDRRRHERAAAGRHDAAAPAPGPQIGRPAAGKTGTTNRGPRSGSSATRPTSRPPSGPATRHRRRAATRSSEPGHRRRLLRRRLRWLPARPDLAAR